MTKLEELILVLSLLLAASIVGIYVMATFGYRAQKAGREDKVYARGALALFVLFIGLLASLVITSGLAGMGDYLTRC